jgi:glycine dehydrogenase subunit 1
VVWVGGDGGVGGDEVLRSARAEARGSLVLFLAVWFLFTGTAKRMDYTQITADDEQRMLAVIGAGGVDELFAPIPADQRLGRNLEIPHGCSEQELLAELSALAGRNTGTDRLTCFLGCGAYDHFIPTIVDHLAQRGEFLTAYTPYQAEASQGTLQAFFEFQTLICELTGMDIANASLYEGASAAAEAGMLAIASTRRPTLVIADTCHPDTVATVTTYANQQNVVVDRLAHADGVTDVATARAALHDGVAALIIQFPNFFGALEDLPGLIDAAHAVGALAVVAYDPIAAGRFKRPGDFGADIVVGEGQALGIPLQYGAPYLGFFAAREKFLRKMPGRMVGIAEDPNGRRGFALVLQTREQHIKRERATSNVCTNQGLMALRAAIYLSAMSRQGLNQVATQCLDKTQYAARRIAELDGFELRFPAPFFKEFVVRTDKPVDAVLAACRGRGILAGVPLGRWFPELDDCFAVAVTEKRTRAEIDRLVAALGAV